MGGEVACVVVKKRPCAFRDPGKRFPLARFGCKVCGDAIAVGGRARAWMISRGRV